MGLDMKTRKKICGKIFRRYQKAGKKGKAKILDEYAQTLEYNRDYLACLLANRGKTRYAVSGGKPRQICRKRARKRPPEGFRRQKNGEAGKIP